MCEDVNQLDCQLSGNLQLHEYIFHIFILVLHHKVHSENEYNNITCPATCIFLCCTAMYQQTDLTRKNSKQLRINEGGASSTKLSTEKLTKD